jgi:hypothetical protein
MNFCVLVKISKHKVSFWYQTEGSIYAPLSIKESNEVPLYFYVCGNDYIFGTMAKDRFYSHDPNSYGDYFDIVTDPAKHFTIYGIQRPVKQLLYYGIEQYLSHFINTVLYKSESIESYRQTFPIRFIFDTDIEDKEKALIESLFKEAGYDNVGTIVYQEALMKVLTNGGLITANNSVLLLTGIDNNLYLELYRSLTEPITGFSKLIGLGADPRVRILAEEILEDIVALHPYLAINKEVELAEIQPYAAGLLDENIAIIKGNAMLSDGKSYFFEVKKRKLNDRINFITKDGILIQGINSLLETNGVSIKNTVITLIGREINTSFFENKLLSTYPRVIRVDAAHCLDTMKLIFYKVAQSGYLLKKNETSTLLHQIPQQSMPLTPKPDVSVPHMPSWPQPKGVLKSIPILPPPAPPKPIAKTPPPPPPPNPTAKTPPPPPPPPKTVSKAKLPPSPPPPPPPKTVSNAKLPTSPPKRK